MKNGHVRTSLGILYSTVNTVISNTFAIDMYHVLYCYDHTIGHTCHSLCRLTQCYPANLLNSRILLFNHQHCHRNHNRNCSCNCGVRVINVIMITFVHSPVPSSLSYHVHWHVSITHVEGGDLSHLLRVMWMYHLLIFSLWIYSPHSTLL